MTSRLYWLATGAALTCCLLVAFLNPSPLVDLRNGLFDLYQRAAPRPFDPAAPVRIVDIDDASLAKEGQWPWPRSKMARLVTRLAESGAAAIAFDMVFAEDDRLDLSALTAELPAPVRDQVVGALAGRADNDAAFAQALATLPSVLGAVLSHGGTTKALPAKWGLATAGDDPLLFVPRFSSAVAPLPHLAEAAAGIGALNWLPDRDQVVRRVPLLLGLNDQVVPSLAAEALRVAQGASTYVVRASNASGEQAFGAKTGIVAVKIGTIEALTDAEGEVRVRFSPSNPARFIPAHKVLDGTADKGEIEGRIILVGTSAAGLKDTRATPLDAAVAGVEIQAQLIEHLVAGSNLARPDWAHGAELVLVGLIGLAIALALPKVSPLLAGLGGLVLIALVGAGSFLAFTRLDLLIDPLAPGASALLVYLVGVFALYRDEQRRRQWVRSVFGRFVSPAVVTRLAEHPDRLTLGGETRVITILFCDLRDFTTLSETMDAQALTRFMRAYLTPMTEVVLAHGGTIDKYIGDAIMAFWNAPLDDPDHARNACLCALAMSRRLDALNDAWRDQAAAEGRAFHPVRCGIGIATGPCCVGNLGSEQRLEYSCLGDDVNVASRIEGATKGLRTDILLSEATRQAAGDLAFLQANLLMLKGKSKPSRTYLLAGDTSFAQDGDFADLRTRHGEMVAHFEAGDYGAALPLAQALESAAPSRLSRFYGLYRERCEAHLVPAAANGAPETGTRT